MWHLYVEPEWWFVLMIWIDDLYPGIVSEVCEIAPHCSFMWYLYLVTLWTRKWHRSRRKRSKQLEVICHRFQWRLLCLDRMRKMRMVCLCMPEVLGSRLCSCQPAVQASAARSKNFNLCNGRRFGGIFVFVLDVSKCRKWPIRPNCFSGTAAICVLLPQMRAVVVIASSCPLLPFWF